jgi:hypothetical protein
VSRSPHVAHGLGSPFASWDSPPLSPTSQDATRRFVPYTPLCAVIRPDLVVVATGSGNNHTKVSAAPYGIAVRPAGGEFLDS